MSDFVKLNGTPPEGKSDDPDVSPSVDSENASENASPKVIKDKSPMILSKEKSPETLGIAVSPAECKSDVDEENPLPIEEFDEASAKADSPNSPKSDLTQSPATDVLSKSDDKSPAKDDLSKTPGEEDLFKTPAKDDLSKTPAKDDLSKIPAKDDLSKTPAKDDLSKTPAKDDLSKTPAKDDLPKTPAKSVTPKTPVKDDSDVKAKTPISPIVFEPSPERKSTRLTRRSDYVKKKQDEGPKQSTPIEEAKVSTPKKGKVISLVSVKKTNEPIPEKKKIVLKRRASSSYDDEDFPETSKASSDAPPKKKYKPITWP